MALHDIVIKGSTNRSVTLHIADSTDGTDENGVVAATAGLILWYRREGAAPVYLASTISPANLSNLSALTDAHSDGGFLLIRDGDYRLDLPDAAFAAGAEHVDFGGVATGMVVIGGRVRLVNIDIESDDGATVIVDTEAILADTEASQTSEASILADTEAIVLDAEAVLADTEAAVPVLTDTEAILVDTEAAAPVLTDTEAILADSEAVLTDTEAAVPVLTDTEAILADTEAATAVITDTEAILVDTEANAPVLTDTEAVLARMGVSAKSPAATIFEELVTNQATGNAVLSDTEASQATEASVLVDTEAVLADTEASQTSEASLLTDTEAILTDSEAVLTDSEAVIVDTEAIKAKTDNQPEGIRKNTARANFPFFMVLATDHVTGATGLAVTAQRKIDGGAFANCSNSPTEVSSGLYQIDLTAADLNGDTITLKFTAATADATIISFDTTAV